VMCLNQHRTTSSVVVIADPFRRMGAQRNYEGDPKVETCLKGVVQRPCIRAKMVRRRGPDVGQEGMNEILQIISAGAAKQILHLLYLACKRITIKDPVQNEKYRQMIGNGSVPLERPYENIRHYSELWDERFCLQAE